MSTRKSILILSFSPFDTDPRVRRQVDCLKFRYRVTVAAFGHCADQSVAFVPIEVSPRGLLGKILSAILLASRRFERLYWRKHVVRSAQGKLEGARFDLVVVNDVDPLPLGLRVAGEAPVVLDAHEYAPRELEDQILWRILIQPFRDYICRNYLRRCARMFTVCDGIAREYNRVYGVSPMVLVNAPPYQSLEPSPTALDKIRLIHHGYAHRSRQIERMIDLFDHVDERFTLDLMLLPDRTGYLEELQRRAARHKRIRFRDPVPMLAICAETNAYDLGLYLLPPTNYNYAHALPNKFFEFVQARLGVAIGPSPEMAHIVEAYGLGVVADSFDAGDLATLLNTITSADVDRFKRAAHVAAPELCFEKNADLLLGEVRRLVGD